VRHLGWKSKPHNVVLVAALLLSCGSSAFDPAGAASRPVSAEVPALRFSNMTKETGISYPDTPTYGAIALDVQRDGALEIILNRHKRRAQFYTWVGERFSERHKTAIQRIPPNRSYYDRHSCVWGEATGDGRLDLYCASGAKGGLGTGANQLLVARGDEWRNEGWARGVADRFGRGRSVNWIDYDGDLDLDLFVANEVRTGYPNAMFRNSAGRFARDSDAGLSLTLPSASSAWSDWDNDGDPDLIVAARRSGGGTVAFRNDDGRFTPAELPGVTGVPSVSAVFGDFNGDGWTDLHLVSHQRSRILENTGGTFSMVDYRRVHNGRASVWFDVDNDRDLDAAVVQGAHAKDGFQVGKDRADFLLVNTNGAFQAARRPLLAPVRGSGDALTAADYDRDGRVDLYIANGYQETRGRPVLLRNTSDAAGWVALRLVGTDLNPLAFGARVTVTVDGVARRMEITDGAVTRAQVDVERLHFGVGDGRYAEVRVDWPDGTSDCVVALEGRETRIEKGFLPCRLIPLAVEARAGG